MFFVVGRRLLSSDGWLKKGGFVRCNKQSSYFRLKRITKLVIGYHLNVFHPLSTPSLFILSPLVLRCHYPSGHPYSTFNNIAVIHWRSAIDWQRKREYPEVL